MSQDRLAKMECSACKRVNSFTTRNKKIKTRLLLNKHCKSCVKHTEHKETK